VWRTGADCPAVKPLPCLRIVIWCGNIFVVFEKMVY